MSNNTVNPLGFPPPIIINKPAEIKPLPAEPKGPSFGEVLENAIKEVSDIQKEAGEEARKLMTGEVKDIHTVMIAAQKAEISFQMMMQVRNKLVNAYQEIMRMPV
jgi:flagellar hook-basal body complex protein FliE